MKAINKELQRLQGLFAAELPGMAVTVNISISSGTTTESLPDEVPAEQVKTEKLPAEMPKDLVHDIDLAALRATLNSYVKQVGPDRAIKLVSKYTGGSKNAADIPAEKYMDLVQEIVKQFPDMALTFEKKDEA